MNSSRRYQIWTVATFGFWGIAAVAVLFSLITDFSDIGEATRSINGWTDDLPMRGEQARRQIMLWSNASFIRKFRLWLDVWGMAAVIILAIYGRQPRNWATFSRFALVILSAAALLGLPAGHLLYSQLEESLTAAPVAMGLLEFFMPPLLLPLIGTLTGGMVLLGLVVTIGFVLFVFSGLPLMAIETVRNLERTQHKSRQQRAEVTNYLARFGDWLDGKPLGALPDDGRGSRFATPEEVEAIQNPTGAAFGHINGKPLLLHTDKHIMIQASTRSGKGVSLIIPHLLTYRGSAFVLDPKGENARATGRQRGWLNGQVCYLDPFGISGKPKSRFNPLARFTSETMEAESKALAAALFLSRERDHWTAAGQQLLAAIILYVFIEPNSPPAKKDLVTVRRLLLGGVKLTLKAMQEHDEIADGMLASLATSFLETPEREFGSILSTAQRETEILDNPFIAACLSAAGEGEEVDFSAWHRGTMTVYLCLSAPRFPVFSRWLRLVLTAALDEMTDKLQPPPLPVCFMLDELATLGHLQAVENAVGLSAGYGVQIVTVFQDVAQMRDLYKGRWSSFIGNAGVRALFNLDDYETAEYWSKFLGSHQLGDQSHDIYGNPTEPPNPQQRETIRPLLTPDEIMRLFGANKMLVLPQGNRPIVSDRVAYWDDRRLDGLWDDPRVAPAPPPETPEPDNASTWQETLDAAWQRSQNSKPQGTAP